MSVKTWLGGTLQLTVTFPSCPGEDLIWDLQLSVRQTAPESRALVRRSRWAGVHQPGDTYILGVWALGVSSGSIITYATQPSGKRMGRRNTCPQTLGTVWKWYPFLLVTSPPCPELSYMVTLRKQGG